jgi:hypothetical protein
MFSAIFLSLSHFISCVTSTLFPWDENPFTPQPQDVCSLDLDGPPPALIMKLHLYQGYYMAPLYFGPHILLGLQTIFAIADTGSGDIYINDRDYNFPFCDSPARGLSCYDTMSGGYEFLNDLFYMEYIDGTLARGIYARDVMGFDSSPGSKNLYFCQRFLT